MRFFAIVLVTVLIACVYGVIHDQITIRICPEYFTVAHPPVLPGASLTTLAAFWGVAATWWVALPLGFLLATGSQSGRRRAPLPLPQIVRLLLHAFALLGVLALAGGLAGAALAKAGVLGLPRALAAVPQVSTVGFTAASWAHGTSYAAGILIGLALPLLARSRRMPSGERP